MSKKRTSAESCSNAAEEKQTTNGAPDDKDPKQQLTKESKDMDEGDAEFKQKKIQEEQKALNEAKAKAARKGGKNKKKPPKQPKKDSKDNDERDADAKKQKEEQKALEEAKAKAATKEDSRRVDMRDSHDDGFQLIAVVPIDQLPAALNEQTADGDAATLGPMPYLTQSPDDPSKVTESQQEEYRTELSRIGSDIETLEKKLKKKNARASILKSALGLPRESKAVPELKPIKLASEDPNPVEDKKPTFKLLRDALEMFKSHEDPQGLIHCVGFCRGIQVVAKGDEVQLVHGMLMEQPRCIIVRKKGAEVGVADVNGAVQHAIYNPPHIVVLQGAEDFPGLVVDSLNQYSSHIRANCWPVLIICIADSVKKDLVTDFVVCG